MPLGPREFLFVAILPGLTALIVLAIGSRVWLARSDASFWAAPLAIVAAFCTAFPNIVGGGWPSFPPREVTNWLPYVALAALGIAMVDSLARLPHAVRALLVFVLNGAALSLLLKFKLAGDERNAMIVAIAALSVIAVLWWWSLEASAVERVADGNHGAGGMTAPLLMLIIATSLALTFALRGNLKFAQLVGSLAAGAGAIVLLAIVRRSHVVVRRGVAMVFAILCVSMIAMVYYLSDEFGVTYAAALLATPIFIGLGRIVPASRLRPSTRVAIRVAFLMVPMAIVLTVAVVAFRKQQAEADPSDPYSFRTEPGSTSFASGDIAGESPFAAVGER